MPAMGRFIERYDSETTRFYLDPPYWGSETDYGAGVFRRTDSIRLAALLSMISGRSILSVNDVPETCEIFARFAIESVSTRLHDRGGKWSDVAEIIVTGPAKDSVPPMRDLLSI
jgi:DNA adenine methylase